MKVNSPNWRNLVEALSGSINLGLLVTGNFRFDFRRFKF